MTKEIIFQNEVKPEQPLSVGEQGSVKMETNSSVSFTNETKSPIEVPPIDGFQQNFNGSNELITHIVNGTIDSASKKILKDFSFDNPSFGNYSGAFKTGDIAWNITTGAWTSGTGILMNRAGIIGANGTEVTFSIDALTGNATFKGTLSTGLVPFLSTDSAGNARVTLGKDKTLTGLNNNNAFGIFSADNVLRVQITADAIDANESLFRVNPAISQRAFSISQTNTASVYDLMEFDNKGTGSSLLIKAGKATAIKIVNDIGLSSAMDLLDVHAYSLARLGVMTMEKDADGLRFTYVLSGSDKLSKPYIQLETDSSKALTRGLMTFQKSNSFPSTVVNGDIWEEDINGVGCLSTYQGGYSQPQTISTNRGDLGQIINKNGVGGWSDTAINLSFRVRSIVCYGTDYKVSTDELSWGNGEAGIISYGAGKSLTMCCTAMAGGQISPNVRQESGSHILGFCNMAGALTDYVDISITNDGKTIQFSGLANNNMKFHWRAIG